MGNNVKRIGIMLQLLLITVLSGCWSKAELKDVAIVAGVGIDLKGKDQIEVTTQSIKPGEKKKDKPDSTIVLSSTGFTVFEAARDLIIKAGKKQNWQHIQAYIISEEAAKAGVTPRVDFLARDHEPRFRMNVFVSKGKAKDILNIKSKINPISSSAIKKALEEQVSLAKAPKVELYEFINKLMEPYEDPYLPIIRKGKEEGFEIFGTTIFKEDKMVGELTPRETRGMLRVLGKVKGGLQIVEFASPHKDKPNYLSIEIKKSKASIHAKIVKNKPQIIIKIKETVFMGSMTQPIELDDKTIKEMEQAYADSIKKEVEHAVSKIQKELKSNIFNFAGVINREHKNYWKKHQQEWETLYPSLDVIVQVKTHMPENGLIRKNPGK